MDKINRSERKMITILEILYKYKKKKKKIVIGQNRTTIVGLTIHFDDLLK